MKRHKIISIKNLKEISLEKNKDGVATEDARVAQEVLWEKREKENVEAILNRRGRIAKYYVGTEQSDVVEITNEELLEMSGETKKNGEPTKRAIRAKKLLENNEEEKTKVSEEITYSIDRQIIDDYMNKKISKETFDKYCMESKKNR